MTGCRFSSDTENRRSQLKSFPKVRSRARLGKLVLERWIRMAEELGIRQLMNCAKTLRKDRQGILAWYDHRDEDFFTTDVDLTPKQIIETYTGRWAIEVTFEETREHVGLETTRGRCARTILRAEPCLFGLYTLVALWFSELPENERRQPAVGWTGSVKQTLTFSDAITLVRRHIWRNWVLESPRHATVFQKLTTGDKHVLLGLLTQAL